MLIPSKFTTLEESTIFKMCYILKNKNQGEGILDILSRTSDYFLDTSEFLHALDILYVLGEIDIDTDNGIVSYAK